MNLNEIFSSGGNSPLAGLSDVQKTIVNKQRREIIILCRTLFEAEYPEDLDDKPPEQADWTASLLNKNIVITMLADKFPESALNQMSDDPAIMARTKKSIESKREKATVKLKAFVEKLDKAFKDANLNYTGFKVTTKSGIGFPCKIKFSFKMKLGGRGA